MFEESASKDNLISNLLRSAGMAALLNEVT
jgi:hypothetical protein